MRSTMFCLPIVAACAGVLWSSVAEGGSSDAEYLARLDALAGAHPKVLVRDAAARSAAPASERTRAAAKLAAFRKRFAAGYPGIVKAYDRLDGSLGRELMREPPATTTKTQFLETMDRIRRFCGTMDRFAQSYLVTGKESHGREAVRYLLHIASWDVDAGGGFRACDEVPMSIMQLGPRVYDWCCPLLTDAERSKVCAVFRDRGTAMFKRVGEGKSIPRDSHGGRMLGFVGVGGIAFYGEFPEARLWLDSMVQLLVRDYPRWGGDDGGWAEGPQYWSWYMGYMIPFLAAVEIASSSDVLYRKPFFRNTIYYGLYCSPLTLPVSPFGDAAEYNAAYAKAPDARFFGTAYGDPYFLWYASQTRSSPRFIEACVACAAEGARAQARPKAPDDIEQSRYFRDIGWVAMHTALAEPDEDVFLLWKCSPYGGQSHSHADQNAFVLSAFGKPLVIASGYYDAYGSPHHKGWTRQTRANNCILVDGRGQASRAGRGRVACYLSDAAAGWGGGFTYACGDAVNVYEKRLTRAIRHVAKLGPRTYVIADDLAAPAAAEYSWLLHARSEMALDRDAATIVSADEPAVLRATVLAPAGVSLSQSGRFDPPPVRTKAVATRGKPNRPDQYHVTATTAAKAKTGAFLVRLTVGKTGEARTVRPGADVEDTQRATCASWEDRSGTWLVMVRRGVSPGTVRFEKARLAGEFAALRIERGEVTRLLVANATGLWWDGERRFAATAPASASLGADAARRWRIGLAAAERPVRVSLRVPSGAPDAGVFIAERQTTARPADVKRSGADVVVAHAGDGGTVILTRAGARRTAPATTAPAQGRAPTAVGLAMFDNLLRSRIGDALAAGQPLSLRSRSMRANLKVVAVDEAGTLSLLDPRTSMRMSLAWNKLSHAERSRLALAALRNDEPADNAIAAFFLMASGHSDDARPYLAAAGELGGEVARAFAGD